MRDLNRMLGVAVIFGFTAAPAFAQTSTTVTTTPSGSGNSGVITGAPGGQVGSPGGTNGTTNPNSTAQDLSSNISSMSGITAPGASGTTASSTISASNIFRDTYGNPYYQGIPNNAPSTTKRGVDPGGFGTALFGTSGGGGGGAIGSATGVGATAGRTGIGGLGGRGGLGGLGGRGGAGSGDPGGVIVQLPVQIMHPAIARFPVTPVATSQLQADVAGMVARTTEIANPAGVSVAVDRGVVTLTGTVRDIEEARTLVGMIRLTPGVRGVRNELKFPRQ